MPHKCTDLQYTQLEALIHQNVTQDGIPLQNMRDSTDDYFHRLEKAETRQQLRPCCLLCTHHNSSLWGLYYEPSSLCKISKIHWLTGPPTVIQETHEGRIGNHCRTYRTSEEPGYLDLKELRSEGLREVRLRSALVGTTTRGRWKLLRQHTYRYIAVAE